MTIGAWPKCEKCGAPAFKDEGAWWHVAKEKDDGHLCVVDEVRLEREWVDPRRKKFATPRTVTFGSVSVMDSEIFVAEGRDAAVAFLKEVKRRERAAEDGSLSNDAEPATDQRRATDATAGVGPGSGGRLVAGSAKAT